ncbi:molybdopterin-dependent oxidoreductase [Methylocystis sp. IM3]|jgi:DMSO/TMAO reductase YedYZ molybdopterin-dependent catalytic subunit|uniref:SorA family sulfite dehydrogenase catalytic subunit n=1 Tax=Methylocystis sp. IM3 TaxID=3136722 RepID=UPI00311A407F
MIDRRSLLRAAGAFLTGGAAGAPAAIAQDLAMLPFKNGERPLASYPGKRPLIRLTSRPPQLETPFSVFNGGAITPNDAFFVRYHLADIPLSIDPDSFRLTVAGKVDRPLSLGLKDLKEAFEPVEIVAVAECSGNSRGFLEPRVAGGQLGNGAMGNARWRGVALKAILDRAGVQAGARQVAFNGLDRSVFEQTPDFVKALDIDHAGDGEVMIAYEMNGEELPWLNGYPVRLVAPGYYATYWVKHLNDIRVVDDIFDGFWMKKAYRIPDTPCACTQPGEPARATVPINRLNVRSFITSLEDGAQIAAGADILVKGIAFDGGYGVSTVLFSSDGGATWLETKLGKDYGRYSFREWSLQTRLSAGAHELRVCAINRIGQTQPMAPLWSPSGYMRNAVERIQVIAL